MGENGCHVISNKKGNKVRNETLWEEMDVMSPVLRSRQNRERIESFKKRVDGVPSVIWERERGEKIFVERIVGNSGGYHFISHNYYREQSQKEILWDIIYVTLSVIRNKERRARKDKRRE
jgi:hypothetical protein